MFADVYNADSKTCSLLSAWMPGFIRMCNALIGIEPSELDRTLQTGMG